ncbi:peptide-binding protein [Tepidimicrobium xylanilyticum]
MRRKLAVLLALVLVLSIFLAACGQKDEPADVGEGEPVETETPAGDVNNPAKGRSDAADTLIIGTSEAKGEFMPGFSSSVYDGYVVDLIFDGLISNDAAGNPVPHLAEKWETDDNKTFTFYLRKDVKFTDGEPLTAEDVKFTYLLLSDPKYDGPRTPYVSDLVGYKEYHDGDATDVEGIKVIDDHTIEFTFTEGLATNIWNFAIGIMPKHIYGFEKGDIETAKAKMLEPLGSGPYKLVKFEPKQYVEFERNEDYFLGAPKVPKLILKFTTPETYMSELEKGTIDVQLAAATNNENKEIIEGTGFLNIVSFPGNSYYYMGFNLRDPRLSDKNVRQALVYGFNREQFVNVYYQGYGAVCNQPISQVSWAYSEDVNAYEYNPEKAIEILEAAGWKEGPDGVREKDGQRLEFIWDTYTESRYVETLIPMLKADWEKIGVKVEANLMEFNALSEKVFDKREFEMYNMGWSLSIDPDSYEIFHSSADVPGGFNCMGFRNEKNDELLEAGRREVDPEKRAQIYQEWAALINEELPYMFINQGENWDVVNKRVKNFNTSPYQKFTSPDIILSVELE